MPEIEGTAHLDLPPLEVWRRQVDPAVLGASIPGCGDLRAATDGAFNQPWSSRSARSREQGNPIETDDRHVLLHRVAVWLAERPWFRRGDRIWRAVARWGSVTGASAG